MLTASSALIAMASLNVVLALANLICCILRGIEDREDESRDRNEK